MKYNISNSIKKFILFFSDIIIIILSITAAFSLRLEIIYPFWKIDLRIFLLYLIVYFSVFYFFNIYQILIRYFDSFSIIKIIKALFISQIILIIINFSVYKIFYFPRSVSFIAPVFVGILIIIHRIILNYLIHLDKVNSNYKNNILIYGINESTVSLLKSIRQFSEYGTVKGFIDVNENYKKREINGIKIFKNENLLKIVDQENISEIIIGPKIFSKNKYKKIFEELENRNIRIRNMNISKNYIKNFIIKTLEPKINFYDIINRPKIFVDKKILKRKIYNKNILVTGGGGSIGGELCNEILKHSPKKLYILDLSEINLFNIINKLKDNFKNYKKIVRPILGDCSDQNFLKNFFSKLYLDDIYHAAAYKHVTFGEENPYSIIKNNIIGTKTIIDFAVFKKIKNFIFISSDKAVNPKSMLGYTKKFGELLVNQSYLLNKKNNINFTIVRFGNVIGSSGSVIPVFLNQISKKNPLTVTNKNAERYFMSISEAVQLVINSSYLNKKGTKTYALDMGEQIKIYNIAKRIIQLSGSTIKDVKNPKGDIQIKIVGLKKGEKISEEITLGDKLIPTNHPKIMLCDDVINNKNIDLYFSRIKNMINSKKINNVNFKKKFYNILK